jgi:hypothetical protein
MTKEDERFVRQPLSDWLKERPLQHLYRDLTGEEIIVELPASVDRPNLHEAAGHIYEYVETLPDKSMMHTIRSQFVRNGHVGYEYKLPGGQRFTRSATRENWEHNLGNLSQKRQGELGTKVSETVYTPKIQNIVEKRERAKKEKLKTAMISSVRSVLDPPKKKG